MAYLVVVKDDPDVYYLESNYIPGVCVESGETSSWTPIKISDLKESSENSRRHK